MSAERETKTHTCKRGHTTEVYWLPCGQWSQCRLCAREHDRRRSQNWIRRENRKVYDKTYREAVKQLASDDEIKLNMKAYDKARREANRENKKAYNKAYNEANREKLAAKRREKRAKEKREHGDK